MSRIGPSQARRRRCRSGSTPSAVPWWITTTWTLTPCGLQPLRLGLDPLAPRAGTSGRRSLPAATSSGVFCSSAPMTPTLTPLTVNTFDGVTQSGALPVAVSTMFVARNGKSRPACCAQQPVDAVVELVVAVATSRRGPRRSRRRSPACPRAGPSSAARRRRCRRRRAAGPAPGRRCELLVEHRRRGRPRRRRLTLIPSTASVVGSSWPWKSLRPTIESGLYARCRP